MTELSKILTTKNHNNYASLILRLIIGYGFMAHGYAKLSRGPAAFAKLLTLLDIPFPHFSSWLVSLTEFFGGFAILLGLFVSITAIPLIATMLVAMIFVHFQYGFSSVKTIGLTSSGPLFGPPRV